jgi:hypothetical protein
MTFRNKIYRTIFAILEFMAVLLFLGIAAKAAEANDPATQEMVEGPEQHPLSLVSFQPWVVEGEIFGLVAAYVYDDVTTDRSADYWEIYDNEGNLLALSWFDRFGIKRTAVDRGIMEELGRLEGIFVVISDGDSA